MNAKDLYEAITKSAEYHRSSAWDAAFVLYNQHHERKLKPGCPSCVKEVRKWLRDYVS